MIPPLSVAFPDPHEYGESESPRQRRRSHSILSDTIVFRSNLVAEVRLGYTRNHFTTAPATLGLDFSTLGIGKRRFRPEGAFTIAMFPRSTGGRLDTLGMNRAGLIDGTWRTRASSGARDVGPCDATIQRGAQSRAWIRRVSPSIRRGQYVFGQGHAGNRTRSRVDRPPLRLRDVSAGCADGGQITGDPTFQRVADLLRPVRAG